MILLHNLGPFNYKFYLMEELIMRHGNLKHNIFESIIGNIFQGILILGIFIIFSPHTSVAKQENNFDLKQKVDEIIQPILSEGYVGITIGIINKKEIQTFGYGETILGEGEEPNGNTIFEIASITKTFTTLLLADMVEKDTFDLKEPVENLLPTTVDVPNFGDRKITLLDLATHTSALPRLPTNLNPADPFNPYADYTEELLHEFLSDYTLSREPGELYEYSNLGLGLLGHALELHEGIDYENLILERICNPLNMESTVIHLSSEQEQRLAQGYLYDTPVPNWDHDVLASSGALRSTVNDMIKYLSANLGITKTTLSKAIKSTHEKQYEISPGENICLGWHMLDLQNKNLIWHNGATYGYSSFIGFIKGKKIGVVILANTYIPGSYSIDVAGVQIISALLNNKGNF